MAARAVFQLFQGVIRPHIGLHLLRHYRKAIHLEDLPEAHLLPLIAIVGRPNVGKSALFNRLVRKRDALVFDTPDDHVTRDYREGVGQLADLQFRLIDTSGLEPTAPPNTIQGRAAALTRGVLHSCHGVLMLLDARQGVIPADEELLQWLRRSNPAPLMIVANKADTAAGRNNLDQIESDLAAVGLELATSLSATSGDGFSDLYRLLQPLVDEGAQQLQQRYGSHSSSSSSTSSSIRRQLPTAYRFSALAAEAAKGQNLQDQHHQQQQQSLFGDDDVPLEAAAGSSWEDTEQQSTAAAADEAEVDRLLQHHTESAAADMSTTDSNESYVHVAAAASDDEQQQQQQQQQQLSSGPLRMAILGLPNVGKSTLMNTLLGYERSLTGPEPGLTRDPTSGWLEHSGLNIQLVDTAGWKRATAAAPTQGPTVTKQQQQQQQQQKSPAAASSPDAAASSSTNSSSSSTSRVLADASLAQAKRALSAVHVVVLLLDAPRLITLQLAITRLELQIASLAIDHGKALIIGLNKADAVPGGPAAAAALREQVADVLDRRFMGAGRLPVVELSALQGSGAQQLLDAVVDAYGKWNKSVHSHKLRNSLSKHSLRFYGSGGASHILQRVKWAVQVKARPPTFAVLLRGGEQVEEAGQRFLAGVIRQSVGLEGVPVRLYVRYNKRPVSERQSGRSRPGRRTVRSRR